MSQLQPRIDACLKRIQAHEDAIAAGEPAEKHEAALLKLDKAYSDLVKSDHLMAQNLQELLSRQQLSEFIQKIIPLIREAWPIPFYDQLTREKQVRDGDRDSVAPTQAELDSAAKWQTFVDAIFAMGL